MLKIVAIELNTISNSRKSSIQTLHTDLKRSTTQFTFKSISAGLTRHTNETKNEEKDSNSSNELTQATRPNGCNARDKIRARFRRYCCGCLSTLYKSFGL